MADKPRFEVVRSAAQPEKSVLDSLIERISPPSLDPRELLRDNLPLPGDLKKYLAKPFAAYGMELVEDTAKDLYTPTERKYTLARGERPSVALLLIPKWIVANGNVVGTVDEIRTAFEGRVVRVVSPGCDAASLALSKMFEDWSGRYQIDARFIPWANLAELDRGFEVPDVFKLEGWEAEPDGAGGRDDHGTPENHDAPEAAAAPVPARVRNRVFISYSHQDAPWLDRLRVQLKPLLRQLREEQPETADELLIWEDTQLKAGDKWRQEIEQALAAAKVAVLLVSSHFLESDFIAEDELPPILQAAEQEGQRILWVLLDACNWEATPIQQFDAAIKPLQRLDGLEEDDQGEVLKKLSQLIVQYLQE